MSSQPPLNGVFASVFPVRVSPPTNRRRYAPAAAAALPDLRQSLKDQLKILFGIGNETFVYGQKLWVTYSEGPFHTHFASCAPLDRIRQPTANDHATQFTKENTSQLWQMLPEWRAAVGSETVMKVLAAVLNDLLTEFVTWSYAGAYRADLQLHLEFWMMHLFSRITYKVLCSLDDSLDARRVPATEVKKWKDMAMARVGALRIDELFGVIVDWDATAPAIDDLRNFTTNPATRAYLTHNFANVLQTRLLHPGASTVEILQLYISIIRSFRILDPKGVLLDRVARRVRRYLRDRDDTVKVIVTGLLADTAPTEHEQRTLSDPDVLSELALELERHNARVNAIDNSEFDWNNMEWMPDPIDAAPDYMKGNKNTDVIDSLITLFDTKDVFVKELQSTLAERLLKNKVDFNQEISVLEHLKIRFGDSALQGCEVMLRDVLESRKVDQVIRRDLKKEKPRARQKDDGPELHAKILSRLFWPSMLEQSFNVPPEVLERQQSYEKGFEALKQTRKLTWLNAVGQVEVELELDDRTFHEEVLPWQAAVIHAFQDSEATNTNQPISKSVTQLASELAMSPTLVRSACIFWASKRILSETAASTFSVLERLPTGSDGDVNMINDLSTGTQATTAAAAEAVALAVAKEAEEADRKQKMAMYHQFVVSMLTNQGAMPLARIAMMLGIVVPGGFPYSNEELKEFLGGMVKEGALEVGNAGVYKVAN